MRARAQRRHNIKMEPKETLQHKECKVLNTSTVCGNVHCLDILWWFKLAENWKKKKKKKKPVWLCDYRPGTDRDLSRQCSGCDAVCFSSMPEAAENSLFLTEVDSSRIDMHRAHRAGQEDRQRCGRVHRVNFLNKTRCADSGITKSLILTINALKMDK